MLNSLWNETASTLRHAPEIALFLSLAIGYAVGRIPIGSVTLGPTVSTLLAAVAIGQIGITVDPLIKAVLFALFIFTVGYRGGPQFFASFKRAAGPQLALALVLAVTAVVTTILVARAFGLDKGAAGGLLAGALTQSPALGTTTDAVGRLNLPPDEAKALASSAAIAYAVTYLFGEFGLLMFVRNVAPILLGMSLKDAAAQFESDHGGRHQLAAGQLLAYHPLDARAFQVMSRAVTGASVASLEARLGQHAFVARIARDGEKMSARPDMILEAGDVVGIVGPRPVLSELAPSLIGKEVDDPVALGVVLQTLDIVVTNPSVDGKSIMELAAFFGARTRGLTLLSLHRVQQSMPITPALRLQIGDVVRLIGDERHVESAAQVLGYADWPSDKSDLVFLGIGIVSGTLLGLLSITLFGVRLSLGAGGGILIAGLVLGWLRAKHPTFGRVPPAAQWIFSDFGLNGFIATIGLSVGAAAVHAIAQQGLSLLLAGVIVTLAPLIVATYFGKLVLKMNPAILCGALAGAQTNAAVLNAVNEAAQSTAPVMGFTLPFAVNNLLLTLAASVIVATV